MIKVLYKLRFTMPGSKSSNIYCFSTRGTIIHLLPRMVKPATIRLGIVDGKDRFTHNFEIVQYSVGDDDRVVQIKIRPKDNTKKSLETLLFKIRHDNSVWKEEDATEVED